MTARTADKKSEPTIIDFRPRASDSAPATIMAGARRPVVSDSERLDSAALTWKSRANTGISG